MVIISPAIYWLIRKIKFIFIILVLAIYSFDIKCSLISGTLACASLFFSMGAYFAIKKQDFTEALWKWRHLICPIAILLMIYQTYSGSAMGDTMSLVIHPWLVIIQSFAIIIVASVLCRYQKVYETNKKLARYSFFIYAFHPFILTYEIKAFKKIALLVDNLIPISDTWYIMTLNYIAIPLVCVGICIVIYRFMLEFMPNVLEVIVGERKR